MSLTRDEFVRKGGTFVLLMGLLPKQAAAVLEEAVAASPPHRVTANAVWRFNDEIVARTVVGAVEGEQDGMKTVSFDFTSTGSHRVNAAEVELPEGVVLDASFVDLALGNGDVLRVTWGLPYAV
jgi:hypothetical protein